MHNSGIFVNVYALCTLCTKLTNISIVFHTRSIHFRTTKFLTFLSSTMSSCANAKLCNDHQPNGKITFLINSNFYVRNKSPNYPQNTHRILLRVVSFVLFALLKKQEKLREKLSRIEMKFITILASTVHIFIQLDCVQLQIIHFKLFD